MRPRFFAPLLAALGLATSAWFAPYRLAGGDEGMVLSWAARLLRGEVFYRDIDAYPLPGASYALALAMGVFGEHLSVARALAALVYVGILLALYAVALPLLGRRRAALYGLSLLCFKFLSWPALTSYFYSDVALAFACGAIALLLDEGRRGEPRRLFAAGLCAGAALACKQSVGLYLGCAGALLAWTAAPAGSARPLRVLALAAGAAVPLAPLFARFASDGVIGAALQAAFVRPLVAYLPTSGVPFTAPLAWWRLGSFDRVEGFPYLVDPYRALLINGWLPDTPAAWLAGEVFSRLLYTSVPLAFGGALWLAWRTRGGGRTPADRRLLVFALLAGAVFLSAFPRADLPHVVNVYPPVLLLLFALWVRGPVASRRLAPALEAVAVLLALAVCGGLSAALHARLTHPLRLARATVWIAPEQAWIESVVRFLDDEVDREDGLFVYGYDAHYYFLTGRYHSWPFVQLYPGQAGGDGGRALAALLAASPPQVIVQGIRQFPGIPDVASFAPELDAWVRSHYRVDGRVFRRYPPPAGDKPHRRVLTVLRPRDSPVPPAPPGAATGPARAARRSRSDRAADRASPGLVEPEG